MNTMQIVFNYVIYLFEYKFTIFDCDVSFMILFIYIIIFSLIIIFLARLMK